MLNGWKRTALGELSKTKSGGTPSRKRKDYYDGTIPWVKSGELNDGYIENTDEHISKLGLKNSSAKLFSPGTLLVALYGATVGKTSILRTSAATNQAVCAITPSTTLDTEYLRYHLVFLRPKLLGHRYGGAQPNISQQIIRNLEVNYPPLPEQKKIAHILSTVQRAVEVQERIIQTTTELKKTLMRKLFTEGLHNEPQKQTEIGPIPESWEVKMIDDLGKCVTGSTPKTKVLEYYNPPTEDFIAPADLGSQPFINESEKKISKEGLDSIRPLPKGAVMCVCIGSSIGKVGLTVKDRSATNQQINSIICNDRYYPSFVYYLMSAFCAYWKSFATFGPVPILSKGKFTSIPIATPSSKTEQEAIAQPLLAIDVKIEIANEKKVALHYLFRTLLHDLMIAKIQVNNLFLS